MRSPARQRSRRAFKTPFISSPPTPSQTGATERGTCWSPVARINAEHTLRGFTIASADSFRVLQPLFFPAIGAGVFVIINIWTSAGFVNAVVGVVVHMHGELSRAAVRSAGLGRGRG